MGLRGPPPTPTVILKARGSRLADQRRGEPKPDVEKPTCPPWLGKEAKAEWKRQVKQLERMGLIAQVDRALLTSYCEAWGEFVALAAEVEKQVKEIGYAAVIGQGLMAAKNKAAERVLKIAQQFGFSPSSRTRLRTPEKPAATRDKSKARFFRAG